MASRRRTRSIDLKANGNRDSFKKSPIPELEDLICRICHDSKEKEPFISPCRCKGSVGQVHKSCLERWLGSSNRARCELCHFVYKLKWGLRYQMWQSIPVWLVEEADRQLLLFDCFFLFLSMALVMILYSFMSILGMYSFMSILDTHHNPVRALTDTGLVILSAVVILACVVCLGFGVRYHFLEWRHWWKNCFKVTVVPYKVKSCFSQTPKRWKF